MEDLNDKDIVKYLKMIKPKTKIKNDIINGLKQPTDDKWPKVGEFLEYTGVPNFYYPNFTNLKEDAEKYLTLGEKYEIEDAQVNSSWVSIYLKDVPNPSVGYNLNFFKRL
jgi:hypothetical protein